MPNKTGAAKKKAKKAKAASAAASGKEDGGVASNAKKQKVDPAVAAAAGASQADLEVGKDTDGKDYGSIHDLWKAEMGATVADVNAIAKTAPEQLAAALAAKAAAAGAAPAAAPAASTATAAAPTPGAAEGKGKDEELRKKWYNKGAAYWAKTEATVDGVLGGFGHVSPIDISQSAEFLSKLNHGKGHALDCGAGIGRISKELLLPRFGVVDLVEQNPVYVAKAKELITDKRMQNFFTAGLQDFTPAAGRYDVIWVQWVLGHLPDDDFVAFFRRCIIGLKPGGYICVKENALTEGFLYDKADDSVMRSDPMLRELFTKAGLSLLATRLQKKFPKELFPVRMYAFQPTAIVEAAEKAAAATAAATAAAATATAAAPAAK